MRALAGMSCIGLGVATVKPEAEALLEEPEGPGSDRHVGAGCPGSGPGPETGWLAWQDEVDDEALHRAGIRVSRRRIVSVGGGVGSFALVDMLRIVGMPSDDIAVLAQRELPHDALRDLLRSSQTADGDRMRSDSATRIDCAWGWPSYAMAEAWHTGSARPLIQVLAEPIFAEPFAPKPESVYRGMEREAHRIGWPSMLERGEALLVRRHALGGYVILHRQAGGGARVAYRADHVHIAVGHAGPRWPLGASGAPGGSRPGCMEVHAMEDHERAYEVLAGRSRPVAVVRGNGMTAARVIQRLAEDRERLGIGTRIVHQVPAGLTGFALQPFTAPRSAFGGPLHARLARIGPAERARLVESISRTTVPRRRSWRRLIARGEREGWYRLVSGPALEDEEISGADAVIDCTGLVSDPLAHPLLSDLVERGGARLNPMGFLDTGPACDLVGMDSGSGRCYASGVAVTGGFIGPADSFWGLQAAALRILDDLHRLEPGAYPKLGSLISARGWWRWLKGSEP